MAKKKGWKRGVNWDVWAWQLDRTGRLVAAREYLWNQRPPKHFAGVGSLYGPGKWVRAQLAVAALCLALLLCPGCALLPEIARHTVIWGIQRLVRPERVAMVWCEECKVAYAYGEAHQCPAPTRRAVNHFLLDVWIPSQNDPWSCSPNPEFLWVLLYGEPMTPPRYVRCERCDVHYAKGEEHECP